MDARLVGMNGCSLRRSNVTHVRCSQVGRDVSKLCFKQRLIHDARVHTVDELRGVVDGQHMRNDVGRRWDELHSVRELEEHWELRLGMKPSDRNMKCNLYTRACFDELTCTRMPPRPSPQ